MTESPFVKGRFPVGHSVFSLQLSLVELQYHDSTSLVSSAAMLGVECAQIELVLHEQSIGQKKT